ncbi:phosphoribosyltransferase [Nocardiopsis sp. HNM0947]|uniref:Phosphoribosyltransferase n=1 Tax=Nocardiopsis coralli TaxID=2772213 RepID=A0ABR9PBL6_9ACTN|nr:phosphoribosyltransferase family protein [Nocardiopsis coralli]MBE3001243.1 phosphoribosyltransferase [Nocardiopsis coralli]
MFRDRLEAGERLADELAAQEWHRPVVLAMPRGGVPVAVPVARRLDAPLDVVVARKIPVPGSPEVAVGATTAQGPPIFNRRSLGRIGLHEDDLADAVAVEQGEAQRRVEIYRGGADEPEVRDRDVIVVDDGLATGMSARAALGHLRERGAASLVLAVPVRAPDAAPTDLCEQVVAVSVPDGFRSVGEWYEDFTQVADDEVRRFLAGAP